MRCLGRAIASHKLHSRKVARLLNDTCPLRAITCSGTRKMRIVLSTVRLRENERSAAREATHTGSMNSYLGTGTPFLQMNLKRQAKTLMLFGYFAFRSSQVSGKGETRAKQARCRFHTHSMEQSIGQARGEGGLQLVAEWIVWLRPGELEQPDQRLATNVFLQMRPPFPFTTFGMTHNPAAAWIRLMSFKQRQK